MELISGVKYTTNNNDIKVHIVLKDCSGVKNYIGMKMDDIHGSYVGSLINRFN